MKKIVEEVYHLSLFPRSGINCYIVEGVLIDAGIRSSFGKISKILKEIPVHMHALTHAHPDHQGASARICNEFNLPFLCHEKEVHRAENGNASEDYPTHNFITSLQEKYWSGKGHPVTKTLKENDTLGNFTVIETPGHAAGHLAFFREKDGVLIIGDAATNMNLLTTIPGLHLPPKIFTENMEENIKSLQKLAKISPRMICFGHGPVLRNDRKQFEAFVKKLT